MSSDPVIRLVDVAVGYGGTTLWRGLDLDVQPGDFLTVLGGNGTGKTTLLRMLLGLHPPASGRVEVLGRTPRRGDQRVGYLPQQRTLDPDLPLRAADLVRLGLDGHRLGWSRHPGTARTRVRQTLEAVGAVEFAEVPIGRLSGGEQQRVRLAQAIVSGPALVLADEPLLSLDLAAQQEVVGLLDARRRETGAAVVLVTHEINPVLPYTDRVLYLAAGRWAAGTPDEVLTNETLSRLYGVPIDVLRVRDRLVIVGAEDALGTPHHIHHESAPH